MEAHDHDLEVEYVLDRMYSSLGRQHRLLKRMGVDMNINPETRPEAYNRSYGGTE